MRFSDILFIIVVAQ